MSPRYLIWILILLLGGAGLYWMTTGTEPELRPAPETANGISTENHAAPSEPVLDEATEVEPATADDQSENSSAPDGSRSSYRVRPVTGEPLKSTAVEIDWENRAEAETALESALAGNIDDTVAVGALLMQCAAGFSNEQQVRTRLSNDSVRFPADTPFNVNPTPGSGAARQFDRFSDYEDAMWAQFAECFETRGMFDQQFRERLVLLAQDGNVAARFLYAMWLPRQSGGVTGMMDWLTYQNLALEFTLENMKQGEPLGLLAYARSLGSFQPAYFTPRNMAYSQAFTLAAQRCGLNNGLVNQEIQAITEFRSQHQLTSYQAQTDLLAEQIVQLFCGQP